MTDEVEYRCFVGNLSWSTSDRGLKAAFEKFGNLLEAKSLTQYLNEEENTTFDVSAALFVVVEKETGRSRGFGFVTFDEKKAMEKAIEAMNGIDLDGRNITVDRSSSNQGSGRDYDDNRSRDRNRGRDHDHDRGRDFGRGRGGGGGGECFKCGKPGHFARECPSDGASGGRYGGRDDRYGGSGGSRGGSRYGPDRNGDRFSGRNRDNGGRGGGDRYGRDRAGPYDRRGSGGY